MSTADLLRRAANHVEQVAAENPHLPVVYGTPAWNPWTSTAGPQIADPLAAWFRAAADAADTYRTDGTFGRIMRSEGQPRTYRYTAEFIDRAADLARVILGEVES